MGSIIHSGCKEELVILTKSIAFIDLETTDADPVTCSIFEYGLALLKPDGSVRKAGSVRFKPWKPITPDAETITGVTNAMVEACPPFAAYAERIWQTLQGKDIGGYNVKKFDCVCLDQEIRRATGDRLFLDFSQIRVIDTQIIFFKNETRTLTDAVKRYCGRPHEDAHGAGADAAASADVLLGQLSAYPDLDKLSLDDLARYCNMGDETPVDVAGKLYKDGDGFLCYNFGKAKHERVVNNQGFAKWMLDPARSFPASTLDFIRQELKRHKGER